MSRPPRVLMLSSEFPPVLVGGLGIHTAHLAPALAAAGCEVTLLGPRALKKVAEEETVDGVRVVRPRWNMRSLSGEVRLLRENVAWVKAGLALQADGRFDLLHAQGWLCGLAAIQLAALTGLPLVSTFHSTERATAAHLWKGATEEQVLTTGQTWEEELVQVSSAVIAVSAALAGEVQAAYRTRRPIEVVHNGIAAVDEAAAPRPPRVVKKLLYVGRLLPQKGVDWMLEALAQVRDLPFELELLGRDLGAPGFEGHLRALAERLGLAERVRFGGFVSPAEVDARYRDADLALVPSRYEPFGLVCLEAMRRGVPLVASRTGGIVEIVDDSTAQLVEPGDGAQLAAAVRRLFTAPEELAARAARARERVAARFTWPRVAEATIEVYRRALAAPAT